LLHRIGHHLQEYFLPIGDFHVQAVQGHHSLAVDNSTHLNVNWDFEDYNIDSLPADYAPGHGWGVINGVLPPGGELLTGSADMEVARDNLYNNSVPFNRADETGATREQHQWLDSVGTPGPIRFAINDTDLKEGETATLKIAVAPELLMSGGAFMGAAEQSLGLDVTYGNDTLHIIMGDFNNNWTSPVDWSHFKDFSMVVHGTADTHDHLEVQGTGGGMMVGLAIDYITLQTDHII